MRLWVIRRQDKFNYDEHDEAVIRAEDEESAWKIAADNFCPIGAIWMSTTTTCVPLLEDGEIGVIVSSFNTG